MLIFAHLHKCAGTSVVQSVIRSGMKLPLRHANGHPADIDGRVIGGMNSASVADLHAYFKYLAADGVEFVALEWDFPLIEHFPSDINLSFFTIFRDPTERFISNYIYDVVSGYTSCINIEDYLGSSGIFTQANYYTKFFAGLGRDEQVNQRHVQYVAKTIKSKFRYTFLGQDIQKFLREEVGIPNIKFGHDNKTHYMEHAVSQNLTKSLGFISSLRSINDLDYQLLELLC